jgi:HK97 family phage prohead protease
MPSSASERLGSPVHVRAVSRGERTIDIVASDFSKDSYNTRIDPNGLDLEQFRKNPVILLSHNDHRFPVAKALPEMIRVEKGEVLMRIQFPSRGKYEEADIAFELYADGFMRGISIGFVPEDWEDVEEGSGSDKQHVRIYRKARLLEVSLVTIPSNDNALAQRAATLNQNVDEVRARAEHLEQLLESPSQADVEKWRGYFEQKQPVNKAASRAMVAFFKIRGEKQPDDELAAFTRMTEIIEEEASEKVTETTETTIEEKQEETTEEPAEKQEEAEKVEEPTETPTQEAPAEERKASVRIPLSTLKALPGAFIETAVEAAVRASQQGIPVNQLGAVVDTLGDHILSTLSQSKHD